MNGNSTSQAFGPLVEDFDRGIDEIPTPAESVKAGLRRALFVHRLEGTEPAVVRLVQQHLMRAQDVLDRCLFSEFRGLVIRYSYC